MRNIRGLIAVPALILGAACAKNDSAKMDEALKSDLTTAAQAQPYQPQQYVSPMEQGYQPAGAQQQYVGQGTGYVAPAPAPVRTRTVYRDRPVYTSSGSSGSSGSTRTASRPTEKHGGRDAAIGAAAGAVIGATTSRDKVKGGVIGAAAGGILGAVIGNNVDIKKH